MEDVEAALGRNLVETMRLNDPRHQAARSAKVAVAQNPRRTAGRQQIFLFACLIIVAVLLFLAVLVATLPPA